MTNCISDGRMLTLATPVSPPEWALLERELIRVQAEACREFYATYFDERGYLLCVPRWGGNDGPDDAAENLLNWTLLHSLGASDTVLDLYRKGWEGHLRQYTEARTTHVPFAREGMYFKEFPVMFDWFHHGEWLSAFILYGLSNHRDEAYVRRVRRYAGFYMDEDPLAPNYDPAHKVIRSMFNGSKGPLLRRAEAVDWAGDPIEVEGRFRPGHGERSYQQMLDHFKDYNDVVGDHPLNLGATTLAFNAYVLTGEEKYRRWLLDYVDAWVERTERNGGIVPTNIGLDGTIGGACGGKWYGGVYGWGFSVVNPVTGELAHRPSFQDRCFYGFANALLMTGDQSYVELWRRQSETVNSHAKAENGVTLYPHLFGDDGWYGHSPDAFSPGALEVAFWSGTFPGFDDGSEHGWIAFLNGRDPEYPVTALKRDFESIRAKVQAMREDTSTPDTRMSDDMNALNPVATENLTQLMLGGLPTGRVGYPLHCRLRYFDAERRRAGLPDDVAALVEGMTDETVRVYLVNLNPVRERVLVVQGGAYGEHRIDSVAAGSTTLEVGARSFPIRLAPGAGGSLSVRMKRYANQPTLSFPWV